MNLLKKLWNWIIRKTATSPELTVVEAEECCDDEECSSETATEILVRLLIAQGINIREIQISKADKLYPDWYDGPATEEAVLESLEEFKKHHGIRFSKE